MFVVCCCLWGFPGGICQPSSGQAQVGGVHIRDLLSAPPRLAGRRQPPHSCIVARSPSERVPGGALELLWRLSPCCSVQQRALLCNTNLAKDSVEESSGRFLYPQEAISLASCFLFFRDSCLISCHPRRARAQREAASPLKPWPTWNPPHTHPPVC